MSLPTYTGRATNFYIAPTDVADIVNLAIELNRPILVEGEPGCGKTMLAYSLAEELGLKPVIKISVKSTSRAQDLLYSINALARLQDAQSRDNTRARLVYPYLSLGDLGRAIHARKRSVVLLDEIDKADIDFPNDLLDVLDTFQFSIPDLPPEEEAACLADRGKGFGRHIEADPEALPIVVITSNREKRLPEPFLRRCLYVRLKFPDDPKELSAIVRANFRKAEEKLNDEIVEAAVLSFLNVRYTAKGNVQKLPSTSEAIDWVKILHWKGETPESLKTDTLFPPYWQMLFKTMSDLDNYPSAAQARKAAV